MMNTSYKYLGAILHKTDLKIDLPWECFKKDTFVAIIVISSYDVRELKVMRFRIVFDLHIIPVVLALVLI